jgi:hypothetical protein
MLFLSGKTGYDVVTAAVLTRPRDNAERNSPP